MSHNVRTAAGVGAMLALCVFKPCAASAEPLILTPVSASASSFYANTYSPQMLINGSGLTGTGREATHTTENIPNVAWNSDISAPAAGQWVEFDLGAAYDVTNALIWQAATAGFAASGVKEYTVSVAGWDHTFFQYPAGTLTLAIATGAPAEPVQVVPLTARGIKYIRFNIQSNWGGSSGVSLSEVRFEGERSAAGILTPVGATARTFFADTYSPQMLINGSGLTGFGREATHTTENAPNLTWNSDIYVPATGQWVEFDLGAAYDLTNALIWQAATAGFAASGLKEYTVSVAGWDHIFSPYPAGTLTLAIATGAPAEPVQVVPLVAGNIRYVRLNILSNWGGSSGVSLGEVRFEGERSAAGILAPVCVSSSTIYDPIYGPQCLIDGSGLTSAGTLWEATHSNANAADLFWHSNTGIAVDMQWVEFDLGALYDVKNALIWQLAQAGLTDRGVQLFTISVAGADHTFTAYSYNNWLNQAMSAPETPLQVVPLQAKNVRYIRFNIQSNWGAGGIVGLSEVRFEVAPPLPPPTEMILLPVAASASSTYDSNFCGPQWMTDGSGMTGAGRLATHTSANAEHLFWHSAIGAIAGEWLEFDLGATYDVKNVLIWQLAQVNLTMRGVREFTISVAGSDHNFSTYSTGNTLRQALGLPDETVQVVPLVAGNIRYIRLNILSNWGDGIVVGLSEVRFEVAPPQPNPAALTLAPIGASASTTYGYGVDYYGTSHLIDGSGLSGAGRRATHTNTDGWNLFWHSEVGSNLNQWVEFDLGAPYDLTNALIWQFSQYSSQVNFTKRGVKAFTIQVAGSDHSFSMLSADNLLNQASDQTEQYPQVMPLKAQNIRYVRFDLQSNWGDGAVVGLNEVRFEVAPPETNAFIRIPVADDVSSAQPENLKQFLIDGSGLTGAGLAATHMNGLGMTSMWLSAYGTVSDQWAEFDLGSEMVLVSAAIWQYNQTAMANGDPFDYTGRGVKRMTIYTAGNSKSYTEYGSVQLARASGYATEPAQLVRLTAKGVRYVKFVVNQNWGLDATVGLSEVRFLYKRTGSLVTLQ